MNKIYQQAEFITSAAKLSQLPDDEGFEVAFAGRSNAGKSSALNTITNRKGLAKVSKTPGRTQLINLFRLDDERRLVDLPGYGYAKVAREVKERWQKTLGQYLQHRECLRGLILIMDIRHPLKELDWNMLQWSVDANLPVHILLTKADKLKANAAKNVLSDVRASLKRNGVGATLQLFSSSKKLGVEDVFSILNAWYDI